MIKLPWTSQFSRENQGKNRQNKPLTLISKTTPAKEHKFNWIRLWSNLCPRELSQRIANKLVISGAYEVEVIKERESGRDPC